MQLNRDIYSFFYKHPILCSPLAAFYFIPLFPVCNASAFFPCVLILRIKVDKLFRAAVNPVRGNTKSYTAAFQLTMRKTRTVVLP